METVNLKPFDKLGLRCFDWHGGGEFSEHEPISLVGAQVSRRVLFLAADLVWMTRNTAGKFNHTRFAKLGVACKTTFPRTLQINGITNSRSMWFYSIQGVFRVIFEYADILLQKSALNYLKDLWISEANQPHFPMTLQLDKFISSRRLGMLPHVTVSVSHTATAKSSQGINDQDKHETSANITSSYRAASPAIPSIAQQHPTAAAATLDTLRPAAAAANQETELEKSVTKGTDSERHSVLSTSCTVGPAGDDSCVPDGQHSVFSRLVGRVAGIVSEQLSGDSTCTPGSLCKNEADFLISLCVLCQLLEAKPTRAAVACVLLSRLLKALSPSLNTGIDCNSRSPKSLHNSSDKTTLNTNSPRCVDVSKSTGICADPANQDNVGYGHHRIHGEKIQEIAEVPRTQSSRLDAPLDVDSRSVPIERMSELVADGFCAKTSTVAEKVRRFQQNNISCLTSLPSSKQIVEELFPSCMIQFFKRWLSYTHGTKYMQSMQARNSDSISGGGNSQTSTGSLESHNNPTVQGNRSPSERKHGQKKRIASYPDNETKRTRVAADYESVRSCSPSVDEYGGTTNQHDNVNVNTSCDQTEAEGSAIQIEDDGIDVYPFILLLLELCTNSLVSGTSHVLYARLCTREAGGGL